MTTSCKIQAYSKKELCELYNVSMNTSRRIFTYKKEVYFLENEAQLFGNVKENSDICDMCWYDYDSSHYYEEYLETLEGIESTYQTMAAFAIAHNYLLIRDSLKPEQRFNVGTHMAFNPKVLTKGGYCVDIIFYEGTSWHDYKPVVLIEIDQIFSASDQDDNPGKYYHKFKDYLNCPTVKEVFAYYLQMDKKDPTKPSKNYFNKVKLITDDEGNKFPVIIPTSNGISQVLGIDLATLFDINTIL